MSGWIDTALVLDHVRDLLRDARPYPREQMDALFKRLTLPGLEAALGLASGQP